MVRRTPAKDLRRHAGARSPGGVTHADVLVVLTIVACLVLVALMALPRQRETARLAGCRLNLRQIGIALAVYDRTEGSLPGIPALPAEGGIVPGPLRMMLAAVGDPDFAGLTDVASAKGSQGQTLPGERLVPGFICLSDPNATRAGRYPAATSYRATTGDHPAGLNGAFAPGHAVRLADIEAGDGAAFTAAFSERLLGTWRNEDPNPSNYFRVPGRVGDSGCPSPVRGGWLGDAGATWAEASWRGTLYNHAIPPNARPSCIQEDGLAGYMGASSGHVSGVNVLIFDGSVRTVIPTIDPEIWKGLATVGHAEAAAPAHPPEGEGHNRSAADPGTR